MEKSYKILKFFLIILILSCFYPVGYYILEKYPETPPAFIHQRKPPYQDTMIYLINLDRSKDRYERILPFVKELHLPFQRISGVDGQKLSEKEIKENIDSQAYKIYVGHLPKKGTIGCSLSHIKAWKTFLESPYQYAFIIEDDIVFEPTLISQMIKTLTHEVKGWDIVNFEMSRPGLGLSVNKLDKKHDLVVYLLKVVHAGAYLLTRDTAKKLLQKALPIKLPIDYYFTRGWELDFVFMGVEPRPITQNQHSMNYHSLIRETSNDYSIELQNKWKNYPYRVLYIIQSSLIRFYYNLKIYLQHQITPLVYNKNK